MTRDDKRREEERREEKRREETQIDETLNPAPHPNQDECVKVKQFLYHRLTCKVRASGGCGICKRVLVLLQMHATQCKKKDCKLLHCAELKMRNRRSKELQAQARRARKMKEGLCQSVDEAKKEAAAAAKVEGREASGEGKGKGKEKEKGKEGLDAGEEDNKAKAGAK